VYGITRFSERLEADEVDQALPVEPPSDDVDYEQPHVEKRTR